MSREGTKKTNAKRCFVADCNNETDTDHSVHLFPNDNENLWEMWRLFCCRSEAPTDHSVICEVHFADDDFKVKNRGFITGGRNVLRPGVEPKLFPPFQNTKAIQDSDMQRNNLGPAVRGSSFGEFDKMYADLCSWVTSINVPPDFHVMRVKAANSFVLAFGRPNPHSAGVATMFEACLFLRNSLTPEIEVHGVRYSGQALEGATIRNPKELEFVLNQFSHLSVCIGTQPGERLRQEDSVIMDPFVLQEPMVYRSDQCEWMFYPKAKQTRCECCQAYLRKLRGRSDALPQISNGLSASQKKEHRNQKQRQRRAIQKLSAKNTELQRQLEELNQTIDIDLEEGEDEESDVAML